MKLNIHTGRNDKIRRTRTLLFHSINEPKSPNNKCSPRIVQYINIDVHIKLREPIPQSSIHVAPKTKSGYVLLSLSDDVIDWLCYKSHSMWNLSKLMKSNWKCGPLVQTKQRISLSLVCGKEAIEFIFVFDAAFIILKYPRLCFYAQCWILDEHEHTLST